jgi:hypothetical protein
MVEAGAIVGIANVHTGALSHSLKALEELD